MIPEGRHAFVAQVLQNVRFFDLQPIALGQGDKPEFEILVVMVCIGFVLTEQQQNIERQISRTTTGVPKIKPCRAVLIFKPWDICPDPGRGMSTDIFQTRTADHCACNSLGINIATVIRFYLVSIAVVPADGVNLFLTGANSSDALRTPGLAFDNTVAPPALCHINEVYG